MRLTTVLWLVGGFLQLAVAPVRSEQARRTSHVEVAERRTPVGWVYDYRVVNSDKLDIVFLELGDAEDVDHPLPETPLTIVSPRLWDSSVIWAFGTDSWPIQWITIDDERFRAPLHPAQSLEGFAIVYAERCPACLQTAFQIGFANTAGWLKGRVRRPDQPFSTSVPVILEVPRIHDDDHWVGGAITLRALVSEPDRVTSLHFECEEKVISDNVGAPFSFTWDSRAAEMDGPYSVAAFATTTDGRTSRSFDMVVNLENGHPRRPAPY